MSKKFYILIAITVAVVLILSACQRSASQVPLATPTATSPFSNVAKPTGLSLVQMYGTQTALVMAPLASPNPLTPLPSPTPTLFGAPTSLPPTGIPGTPATPTAHLIVPTATFGRPASYTLQSGEYPYCIARRFNLNPQELLNLNNLADGQLLQPGYVLRIPQTGSPFPGARALHIHPSTYTITSPEDTIYKVACYYGDASPDAIAYANSLVPPYTLHVSQILTVP